VRRLWVALGLVAFTASIPASAHHSFASVYFEEQTVSVEGEVIQFDYISPHTWVHIMAKDQNGDLQRFSAEWSNPARLKQQGLTAESIKPGQQVVITGSPARNPANRHLHLKTITRPADGWNWPAARVRR